MSNEQTLYDSLKKSLIDLFDKDYFGRTAIFAYVEEIYELQALRLEVGESSSTPEITVIAKLKQLGKHSPEGHKQLLGELVELNPRDLKLIDSSKLEQTAKTTKTPENPWARTSS